MFSAWGPEVREAAHPLELAVDEVPVDVQERQRLEAIGDGVCEQPAQRRLRDRAPAETRDHRVAVQLDAGERHADVGRDDPADAHGERLLEHEHALCVAERGAHRVQREWPERRDPEAPIFTPCSRISSTVSLIVPSTEPSATTIVSASSAAVGADQAP